jgi:hypothetical protein
MSDIVDRLRVFAASKYLGAKTCGEAADEIDRLRADNEFLKDGIEKHVEQGIRLGERAEAAEAERDRLREALEIARDTISPHDYPALFSKLIAALAKEAEK